MSFLASVTDDLKKRISPCSGSQFKIPVHHGGEVTVGVAGPPYIHSQRRRMGMLVFSSLSPFCTTQIPAQGMVPPPQWTIFLTSVNLLKIIPPQAGQKHTSQVTMTHSAFL